MDQQLQRNICKLPDGAMNSDIPDLNEKTEQHVNKALRYACRSWHKHLVDITPVRVLEIASVLRGFLERKFLFWLEVLSVLGAAREAVDALEATAKWLDVCSRFAVMGFQGFNQSGFRCYRISASLRIALTS
jgi:hypothetical protein